MPTSTPRRKPWLGLFALILLGAIARQFPPNGTVHGSLPQFFGRFHPLIVHLPIGLILLVPALEIAALFPRWAQLRSAAGFVLFLSALTAVIAAYDGWLLAWSGGYGGAIVIRHMWGGVGLAALCLALDWMRPRDFTAAEAGRAKGYALALAGAVGLMAWTTDQGGEISHGANYLTEYMPRGMRAVFGVAPPRPKPPAPSAASPAGTFYAARVAPVFEHNCISCHGPKKTKGSLRLDSYGGIMRGGEDGIVVVPWHPKKSDLIRRVTLSSDDDDFMPSGGKKPLTAAEIQLIAEWIAAGASDKEPADAEAIK